MIKQLSSADLVLPEDFVTSTSNDDEKWEPIVRRSEGHDGLQKEQHEKLERIALCLAGCGGGIRGDVGKVRSINLWELRQLALSNGGLIDGKYDQQETELNS